MASLPPIEAVLFDLGGTLVDYPVPRWPTMATQCLRGVYGCLVRPESERPPPAFAVPGPAEANAQRRPAPPDSALAHRVMMGLRRVVRSLSGRTLPRIAEACARPLVAPGHLFEDSLPTLRALKDRGYRLGLLSNTPWGTPRYLWVRQLERFALAEFFEVALFSSVFGVRKPDERIFRTALASLGVAAGRSVMIGDNPEADIVGAQGAGMRTVLITRPGIERVAPRPAPDLRIDTLLEILDYLPPREG
jgi:putative hydrolase of the HAD superfamily